MHPVKRIEIIVDSIELPKILEGLEQANISSYAVIRNVTGKGVRGTVAEDSAVTMMDNAYVIAFCSQETVAPLVERIRPILNRFGGSCWISDAMEIRSVQCVT